MVSFLKTGDWFKESGVEPLEKFIPPHRYYCVLNIAFWILFTLIPFFYFSFIILMSGNLLYIVLFFAPLGLRKFIDLLKLHFFFKNLNNPNNFLFTVYVALSKLVNVTEISKTSSSYGMDKQKTK